MTTQVVCELWSMFIPSLTIGSTKKEELLYKFNDQNLGLNNHIGLGTKHIRGTKPQDSFSSGALELLQSLEHDELQPIIWSITSFPSHIILISQISGAFLRALSAMAFRLLETDLLLIPIIKCDILVKGYCY